MPINPPFDAKLNSMRLYAARQANAQSVSLTLWNLNTIGAPLYVVRNARPDDHKSHQYVATFHPETIDQNG
jgi:hypothetical protein